MSNETEGQTALRLFHNDDKFQEYIFLHPMVVFKDTDKPDQIRTTNIGETYNLMQFLLEFHNNPKSIVLSPGGVLAVLYHLDQGAGTKITEPLKLTFAKRTADNQILPQVMTLLYPIEVYTA